jgi:hypothetical protein
MDWIAIVALGAVGGALWALGEVTFRAVVAHRNKIATDVDRSLQLAAMRRKANHD